MNAVIVSNIPAPYREPVYQGVARGVDGDFAVLYCQALEPDRAWSFELGDYPKIFLEGRTFSYHKLYEHYVHWNKGIWRELRRLNPQIVITNGYNPTHLAAFLWARLWRRPHIAMTDGWLCSEAHLSPLHRMLRRLVLQRSAACIGASQRSLELFRHYGVRKETCFISELCTENACFEGEEASERSFDLMFSGQFIERKMPFFFCEVARLVKERRRNLRVLLLGDGPLREEAIQRLRNADIEYEAPGFLQQEELPQRYRSARLFLFPTLQECWGVVVNEACASGTPILTCTNTATVGELVRDGENGRVLPLDAKKWAEAAMLLLEDEPLRLRMAQRARELVAPYTFAQATKGILDALEYVGSRR